MFDENETNKKQNEGGVVKLIPSAETSISGQCLLAQDPGLEEEVLLPKEHLFQHDPKRSCSKVFSF